MKRLLLAGLLLPALASAEIFKCVENGQTIFSDKPCGKTATLIQSSPTSEAKKETINDLWTFHRHVDDMTGAISCLIISPNFGTGLEDGINTFRIGNLRVGLVSGKPLVAIKSEKITETHPPSFHTNISGLGIKVDGLHFLPVATKVGSDLLAFNETDSQKIIDELMKGSSFRVRLRYWPYDKTYDSFARSQQGLKEAYSQIEQCEKEMYTPG